MANCYYTCNLLPLELVVRSGHSPRWLGNHLRDAAAPARREALSIHPMTCPYVTKLVAAADELLGGTDGGAPLRAAPQLAPTAAAEGDCLVVPGGCDAMRRLGDLLAATYPNRVFVLSMPRSSGPDVVRTLAADLRRLEDWLGARLPAGAARTDATRANVAPGAPAAGAARGPGCAAQNPAGPAPGPGEQESPTIDYPSAPRPGGVFLVAGPLSNDSLLRVIGQLGADVAGLESCTSPDRWKPLGAALVGTDLASTHEALAARVLEIGVCPRRSTLERRNHLARRLDDTCPSSIIYARQSFCDPGAYDALLVAKLAEERSLPYLEIEVDFPFDATGPLRTRVEAFLEAQSLDDDLLDDDLLDDDLLDDLLDDPLDREPFSPEPGGRDAGDPTMED